MKFNPADNEDYVAFLDEGVQAEQPRFPKVKTALAAAGLGLFAACALVASNGWWHQWRYSHERFT